MIPPVIKSLFVFRNRARKSHSLGFSQMNVESFVYYSRFIIASYISFIKGHSK